MALSSLFNRVSKSQFRTTSSAKISKNILSYFDPHVYPKELVTQFQGTRLNTTRSFVTTALEDVTGFDEMSSGLQRKYYMLGGKGGVGKTSCAASMAVKFANHGHPTIVVSTDPAHSLSDSFDQDLTGGGLVRVQGMESPLYALELGELKLGELLDTPPPGFDEAFAIAKVMQFVESPEYCRFSRIVFDTAPTGHTLRLLSLPDFFDASVGKMMRLKKKIASATTALKYVLGKGEPQQDATDKLEQLRERMAKVRDLFRNSETTEFVIVMIPTVMALRESSRLCASLLKEKVPVRRLVVNQLLPQSASDCKFCAMKTKDQNRVLDMIPKDPELAKLALIRSHLMDVEIRGIPALKFMGDMVWR
ncbi:ATPase GET3B-like isoform X3 [Primulina huaijiensis]|uniref:ATPase GET3B-like isoform X3 n=1 Tax=Primulina huaijiensis TaxID=1492673 RepID=UPI003CC775C6